MLKSFSLRHFALGLCAAALSSAAIKTAEASPNEYESVLTAKKTAKAFPLIISEYIHEGEKRAIEIFNTSNKRDLSSCLIVGYAYAGKDAQKGSPTVVKVPLSGSVKKNQTVTLCSAAAMSDSSIKPRCDLSLNNFNMNGNDPFVLVCDGKDVDVFGLPEKETTGPISGTGKVCNSGSDSAGWSCNNDKHMTAVNRTLRRKSSVTKGRTSRGGSFDLGDEWILYPKGTWTDLGHHGSGSSSSSGGGSSSGGSSSGGSSSGGSSSGSVDINIPGAYADIKNDPNRRHQDLEGLKNDALIDALHKATGKKYRELGYKTARKKMFGSIDRDSEGKVECIYTGKKFSTQPDAIPSDSIMNAEHSWPQSDGATGVAKSDLHHIFPTETKANSMRSSYDFGETPCSGTSGSNKCKWEDGGSQLGNNKSGSLIFEVRPKFRGDIARAHFYFAVRYNKHIPQNEENILRAWHHEDPVDSRERKRNNEIEKVQLNRNCFVDRPDFVDLISDF